MRVSLAAVAACCVFVAVGMVAESHHRQVMRAAARAQDRAASLEHQLHKEREACARTREQLAAVVASRPTECVATAVQRQQPGSSIRAPASPLASGTARAEVRDALLAMSQTLVADGASPASNGSAASEFTVARFVLHEALGAEEPSWCSCPPAPDLTKLCSALQGRVASSRGGEHVAASASVEADALRRSLLEANARAQEASERAIEAAART